jgi:3-oxoacyl-[acyl-carrier protein] reductase
MMHQPFSLHTVLIAGASQGIGAGIAAAFACAGARVICGGRRVEKLALTVAGLKKCTGVQITSLAGDYADAIDAARNLRDAGQLDVLVICYGDTDASPGFDTDDESWDRLIVNNLSGPARLARLAAIGMKERGRGVILFIGSICGHEILGAPIAYNAGKIGLRAVVKTMAHELGPHGVRVNMISPGNVLFEGGRWAKKKIDNPFEVDELIKKTVPLGRFGTPDDIAQAALFLCSEAASFITGSDLVIDGGQTNGI